MSEGYERNDLKTDMVFHKNTAMQRGTAGKGRRAYCKTQLIFLTDCVLIRRFQVYNVYHNSLKGKIYEKTA